MHSHFAFRVNEPHVISEIIEGEVIILNLERGSYFSLNESGMVIWQAIRDGLGRDDMLRLLAQRYACDHATLEEDLAQLLKTLEEEQLISNDVRPPQPLEIDGEQPGGIYLKPRLDKFTDLEDLLLLDPIHDVDQQGWPHNAR